MILQEMPITKADGTPGLLAQNKLGVKVQTEFPNLVEHIEKYRNNQVVISALYRDYSFLASAYLLEPCHHEYQRTSRTTYGLARDLLPENIAVPIAKVAELAGFMPFMEYAGSYALANWKRLDPSKPVEYGNLALIRAFENGLDRESSEAGFVLVHVDMVRSSGPLVAGAWNAVEAVERGEEERLEECLREMLEAIQKINACMENMWNKSKPRDYGSFRTFIFGITKQSMFPRGVIYEGVSSSTSPTRQSFRGESGANDSIIPLLDIFLDIPYPHTPLTDILLDFRKYRPGNHREFLEWMHRKQETVGMRKMAMKGRGTAELWLRLADQVREFRWRHWCFTREYVLKESRHPVATGGSPIVNVSFLAPCLLSWFRVWDSCRSHLPMQ
ncbi:hypothetical protein EX30DRAFT_343879 [Ascodesmis nigricans]|uniref:Indoleamine 2,3-dioxygenase n=1 Tax=Ascodesmis nigricans TaxID=341454 RepID=A0A4S2ML01_9PEZI|nr:hypothetical protein EX30DRAFT_343879 [Ascodesmis nigricans]